MGPRVSSLACGPSTQREVSFNGYTNEDVMQMEVALMNLGDAPRVFHNRLNRAVVVPVGRVVAIDLNPMEVQNLRHPSRGETVVVVEPGAEIPPEMQKVVDLLAVLKFESHERAVQRFLEVIPPGSSTDIRPSRMQMIGYLQTMVEDFVQQAANPGKRTVRDDEDPEVLRRELERQKETQSPVHPMQQIQQDKVTKQLSQPARQSKPSTTSRERGTVERVAKAKRDAKNKRKGKS